MTYQHTEYPEPMTYQQTAHPVNTYQETGYPTESYIDSVNQYETYEPEAENWETKNYQETVYPDMTDYQPTYPTKTYDYASKAYQTEYPEPMTYQQTAHPVNTYQETGYPTESYYNTPYYNTIPPQVGQEIDQSSEMYTQTVYPSEYPVYPTETYTVYPAETYTIYPAETYTATMTMQPEFQVPDYHTYTATAPTNALGQYEQYTAAPLSTYPTATEYSQAPEAYTTSTDASQLP